MDQSILVAAAGGIAAGFFTTAGGAMWRKLSGNQYMSKTDCKAQHDRVEKDCEQCKAATKASICSIQHEGAKTKKLLLLIAIQLKVPQEKLEDFL